MAEEKKKSGVRSFVLDKTDVAAIGIAFMTFAQNPFEKDKFHESAKRELEDLGLSDSEDKAIAVVEACIGNILNDYTEVLAKSVASDFKDFFEYLEKIKNKHDSKA